MHPDGGAWSGYGPGAAGRTLCRGLNRAGEIVRQGLRGRSHFILERGVLPHPEGDAAVRVLLLRQRRLMQNGGIRDLDVVGQVRAEV
jgi:hypothetical protein